MSVPPRRRGGHGNKKRQKGGLAAQKFASSLKNILIGNFPKICHKSHTCDAIYFKFYVCPGQGLTGGARA